MELIDRWNNRLMDYYGRKKEERTLRAIDREEKKEKRKVKGSEKKKGERTWNNRTKVKRKRNEKQEKK